MLSRVRKTYGEYPSTFWTLIGATFIDQVGGALLFPFFALYVTEKFRVGMTEVGVLFTIFAAFSLVGTMLGGALTDRMGRRWMLIFGLVVSATSSLLMMFVTELLIFYVLAALVGLLANAGGPAQQAMVADLLPEEKLSEGYGMQRVAMNLAVVIGPAIGGLLAATSFNLLFIIDATTSIITALIVYFALPETKPVVDEGEEEESLTQTFGGYARVAKDSLFMSFLLVSIFMVIVSTQLNSTLSVYLRDEHGLTAREFGYLLSLNAALVVIFQISIARRISKWPAMLMMAFGTLLYAIGFSLYGFVNSIVFFILAMVIITVGEMIVTPVAQTLVARLAPEDMRGRYMAVFGFSWSIPFAIGPLLAGLIMDNLNPDWVWYAAGLVGLIAVGGFLVLYLRTVGELEEDVQVEQVSEAA
jgi:MFS family permease